MTDYMPHENQRQGGLLNEHVTTAAAFNREMKYLSMPYRMVQELHDGNWVLEDSLDFGCLHIAPTADEAIALHIMRAWIYGLMHERNIAIGRQYLRGELPDDDANPY
jgi:hypothetical protein